MQCFNWNNACINDTKKMLPSTLTFDAESASVFKPYDKWLAGLAVDRDHQKGISI